MICPLLPPPRSPSVQQSPLEIWLTAFSPHPLERYQVWGLGLHLSSSGQFFWVTTQGQGKVTGVTQVARNSCWKHKATSKCRPTDTRSYISGLLQIKPTLPGLRAVLEAVPCAKETKTAGLEVPLCEEVPQRSVVPTLDPAAKQRQVAGWQQWGASLLVYREKGPIAALSENLVFPRRSAKACG